MDDALTNPASALPDVSVILCTHNPREDYLQETLDALKAQSLPNAKWELLLVDNASKEPLTRRWDLTWHPLARHLREETLGLTPARLRGIAEARASLLIFVDDDNLLAPDYLKRALEIAHEFPFLGAWGGSITARFEVPPAEWVKPHLGMLAIREVRRDVWSNVTRWAAGTCPMGAGMCVRLDVAMEYKRRCQACLSRLALDRSGTNLVGGGDTDLAYTACDMGLGNGLFAQLHLTHLIPERRLRKDYLLRLSESLAFSDTVLNSLRDGGTLPSISRRSAMTSRVKRWLKSLPLISTETERVIDEFADSRRRGQQKAVSQLSRGLPSQPNNWRTCP